MTASTGTLGALPLRDYQQEAIDTIADANARGVNRPAVVLPTGAGKTVVFAHLAKQWCDQRSGRVLVLVHRDELVRQTVGKMHSIAPHLPCGVIKAAENDVDAQVIVASVQTLRNRARMDQIRNVDLIIVDECHHAMATTYLDILEYFGSFEDHGPLTVGFTATMNRSDNLALGQVWQEVVYERDIIYMIRRGFLADVKGIALTVDDYDLSKCKVSGGDYRDGDLGRALEQSSVPKTIATAYQEHAPNASGLVFTPTVDTAHLMSSTLTEVGISTLPVWGSMPSTERRAALRDFSKGTVQALTNCAVLTEGTDLPRASLAVIARPTLSSVLYQQMVGRVLRPFEGKERALVLDVAGASQRHSLVGLTCLTGADLVEEESLLEQADRLEAEQTKLAGAGPARERQIKVKTAQEREIDLFHGSRLTWLQTDAGFWFLPADNSYVAIIPSREIGAWDVALYGRNSGGRWIQQGIEDVGYAMVWGEKAVEEIGVGYSEKERAWRKRKATVKAKALATTLGIEYADDIRGGELGDKISAKFGSQRIDSVVIPYLTKIGAM